MLLVGALESLWAGFIHSGIATVIWGGGTHFCRMPECVVSVNSVASVTVVFRIKNDCVLGFIICEICTAISLQWGRLGNIYRNLGE